MTYTVTSASGFALTFEARDDRDAWQSARGRARQYGQPVTLRRGDGMFQAYVEGDREFPRASYRNPAR